MLQTKRLNLRELSLDDLSNIHLLHSLPETDRYNTLGIPEDIETTEKILSNWLVEKEKQPRNSYVFGLELKDTNVFIGLIAINLARPKYRKAEVWFKIHKDFWNNGYTTEALLMLLEFGF